MKPHNAAEIQKSGLSRLRKLNPANQDRPEIGFLPAALEVIERPPSPAGRMLLYSICAFFLIAVAWSYFGQVDEVATAQGRIIPSGKVKVIQPLEIGAISRIDVAEGQSVKAGDVLVEIDPTESSAEAQRLQQELTDSQTDAARFAVEAAASGPGPEAENAFMKSVPAGADPDSVRQQLAQLRSDLSEQAANLASIDGDIEQKRAQRKQVEADVTKLHGTLPLIEKRATLREALVAKGYSSVIDESREQQSLIENRQALAEDMHKLDESDGALRQLEEQRKEAVSKFLSSALKAQSDAQQKAEDTGQQLIKAKDLAKRRTLTSPVEGVVQQLAVHTVGGIVTPAQDLMVIVPKGAVLEIEANIPNKDIGFVHEGQSVEIKLETFPFTRYGLRHGTVLAVSRDSASAPQQQPGEKPTASAAPASSPQSSDPTYTARISLDKDTMLVDGKIIQLTPGMTVTAEIKTGRQRVLDYLLDPIRRYRHDSFQER